MTEEEVAFDKVLAADAFVARVIRVDAVVPVAFHPLNESSVSMT